MKRKNAYMSSGPAVRVHSIGAFSLIEVTLSVAIVGLALAAILGLMPVGIQGSRQVADETTLTSLANNMLSWRRITPYDNPSWMPPGAPALSTTRPYSLTAYYDADGRHATNSGGTIYTNWAGPYAKFTYTIQDHPQFPGAPDAAQLVILVEWPCVNTGTFTPAPPMATNLLQRRTFVSNYVRMP